MFTREGPHRGSVYRRSAASSQVLFQLERSLTYHCAWHLRLTESWMSFHLPEGLLLLSESCAWPLAVTSELRPSPHSVRVITRALSTELLLSPLAARGWDAALLCEALVPQPCGDHSRGEAMFPRASGRRLHVVPSSCERSVVGQKARLLIRGSAQGV